MKDVLYARKVATETEKQSKENRRLQAEKARQLQIEKDTQEKEAKRLELEKAQIIRLLLLNIEHVHRLHLMRLINWVQATMLTQMKNRGQKRYNPNIRRQQRQAKLNHLKIRVQILIKIHRMHY